MSELSSLGKIEFEVLLKGASSILELNREDERSSHDIKRSRDRLTSWTFALSAGAILVMNIIPQFANVPRRQAFFTFLLFGASVLFALMHKFVLERLDEITHLINYNKHCALTAYIALLARVQSDSDISSARSSLCQILEGRKGIDSRLLERAHRWASYARILQYIPLVTLLLGASSMAIVSSLYWQPLER
jgi:hypothetical protein